MKPFFSQKSIVVCPKTILVLLLVAAATSAYLKDYQIILPVKNQSFAFFKVKKCQIWEMCTEPLFANNEVSLKDWNDLASLAAQIGCEHKHLHIDEFRKVYNESLDDKDVRRMQLMYEPDKKGDTEVRYRIFEGVNLWESVITTRPASDLPASDLALH
jgi:hypothetical protein